MDWRPTGSLAALRARASLYRQVRAFFQARGVLEVETPALSQAGNTDPNIHSFRVDTPGGSRYLHTSPEYPMKRLLAAGSGDIFQICKVWRQDESGRKHNPEFSMLEYYRVGFTYPQLMREVAALLHEVIPHLKVAPEVRTYRECFLETLGIDPHVAPEAELATTAAAQGIDIQGTQSTLSRQAWLDLLFTHCIEARFPTDRLTFVCHYPATQAALARIRQEASHSPEHSHWVAERFEVYLGSLELGNGYQEQTDATPLERVLREEGAQHAQTIPVDVRFIAAVQAGMPFCAGIALGLDRILLCRMQEKHLHRVVSFAWDVA